MKRRGTCNRYRVKGKQLASLSGDPEGRPIFAVKLEPAFSVFLREQYPATVPGYQHFFYALPQYLVEDLLRDMAAPKLPPGGAGRLSKMFPTPSVDYLQVIFLAQYS